MYFYAHTSTDLGNGQVVWHSRHRSLAKVDGAICQDGVARVARCTGEPDTFFSVPAAVKVKGVSVAGYLIVEDLKWFFRATGKHAHLVQGK